MPAYHLVLISPTGYVHSECLREVLEGLEFSFRVLGYSVTTSTNSFAPHAVNIVLGPHLLDRAVADAIPVGSILLNLEQIGGAQLSPVFLQAAMIHQIWDYSPLNLERWASYPLRFQPRQLEIGYVPELQRIAPAPVQDIDVLFYGSVNPRRRAIGEAMMARGLRVLFAFAVYGAERDALIARSRVVLNIHHYDTQVFEVVRVAYLLNNGKAVVTETSPDLHPALGACVLGCPYEELVEQTVALLADEPRRRALELDGATRFREMRQVKMLSKVLEEKPERASREAGWFPRRLNLGSGKDWREDCLNIDINDYWRPDAVLDIAQPQPDVIPVETDRFGAIELTEGCFDEILANDVLEHIPDLMRAMTTALRLLRVGGVFNIHVPYDLAYGAWQDPTHVRAFNERSWLYYTDWFWYMGWTEARFRMDKLDYTLSPLGETLRKQISAEDLVRSPRAVDSMRVLLVKQPLTPEEQRFVEARLARPERRAARVETDMLTPA